MDYRAAATTFAALSQERRVALVERLVGAGRDGLSAGEIARALDVRPSTLSFHLAALEEAGLVAARRDGRRLIYAARPAGLAELARHAAALCPEGARESAPEPSEFQPAFDVLFLCRHNSARSIMAEAILDSIGGGRFRAHSAGPTPAGSPLPPVIELLRGQGHSVEGLRSKPWSEFAATRMDLVLTLCDMGEAAPPPGRLCEAVQGLWLLPDPTRFGGSVAERMALLKELYRGLRSRLERLCRLPLAGMERAAVAVRLAEIGDPATA